MSHLIKKISAVLKSGDLLIGEDISGRSVGSWGRQCSIKAKAIVRPKTDRLGGRALQRCDLDEGQQACPCWLVR